MLTALTHGRILTDQGVLEGRDVLIDNGRIVELVPPAEVPRDAAKLDLEGHLLLPGFVDIQVNGGGGALFGEAPTVDTLKTIAAAHRRFGTTAFLPTLISSDLDVIARAIAAVDEAIATGVQGVAGIHIEGPFISPLRKGIHDASKFRKLDSGALNLISSLKRGRTLITLAPEETTPDVIASLHKASVIVSAGHTDATYEEAQLALESGLSGFTHLFNAMSPLASRAPGVVGAALDDRDSMCGIIVDGRHIHPVVMRVALRCKTADKLMLVTDAMPSVGARDKTFRLDGRLIRAEDGACVAEDGTLAGTDLDMASAVRNAMRFMGLDLHSAARMASRNPATFLGLGGEMGRIARGLRANLVLVTDTFSVVRSWIDGRTGESA
ncbi:MAG TPA: N-acetylglucosamine-6-phosphate deacetylase [Rhizomicrobium sp.]|nr:N-acetylglucosamine-6-phosphate deacetylase [Rhizomicrobium sp.]